MPTTGPNTWWAQNTLAAAIITMNALLVHGRLQNLPEGGLSLCVPCFSSQ